MKQPAFVAELEQPVSVAELGTAEKVRDFDDYDPPFNVI